MKIIKRIGAKLKALGCAVALLGSLFYVSPVTAFAFYDEEEYVEVDSAEDEEIQDEASTDEEEFGPLTPDGNMTLVDDYGSIEAGGKQFITVVTKNGNYFYIIIDRDDDGEETVHFLNMVDESDLLSLMDEDEVSEYIALTSGNSETVEEDKTPTTVETVEEEVENEASDETVVEVKEKKSSNVNGIMALILIVALAGAGGYFYFKTTKNAKRKTSAVDPDADYVEDAINLPTEEEPEFEQSEEDIDLSEALDE